MASTVATVHGVKVAPVDFFPDTLRAPQPQRRRKTAAEWNDVLRYIAGKPAKRRT